MGAGANAEGVISLKIAVEDLKGTVSKIKGSLTEGLKDIVIDPKFNDKALEKQAAETVRKINNILSKGKINQLDFGGIVPSFVNMVNDNSLSDAVRLQFITGVEEALSSITTGGMKHNLGKLKGLNAEELLEYWRKSNDVSDAIDSMQKITPQQKKTLKQSTDVSNKNALRNIAAIKEIEDKYSDKELKFLVDAETAKKQIARLDKRWENGDASKRELEDLLKYKVAYSKQTKTPIKQFDIDGLVGELGKEKVKQIQDQMSQMFADVERAFKSTPDKIDTSSLVKGLATTTNQKIKDLLIQQSANLEVELADLLNMKGIEKVGVTIGGTGTGTGGSGSGSGGGAGTGHGDEYKKDLEKIDEEAQEKIDSVDEQIKKINEKKAELEKKLRELLEAKERFQNADEKLKELKDDQDWKLTLIKTNQSTIDSFKEENQINRKAINNKGYDDIDDDLELIKLLRDKYNKVLENNKEFFELRKKIEEAKAKGEDTSDLDFREHVTLKGQYHRDLLDYLRAYQSARRKDFDNQQLGFKYSEHSHLADALKEYSDSSGDLTGHSVSPGPDNKIVVDEFISQVIKELKKEIKDNKVGIGAEEHDIEVRKNDIESITQEINKISLGKETASEIEETTSKLEELQGQLEALKAKKKEVDEISQKKQTEEARVQNETPVSGGAEKETPVADRTEKVSDVAQGAGIDLAQLQEVNDLLAQIRTALGTLDEDSDMPNILQSIMAVSDALQVLIEKLDIISQKDFNLNIGLPNQNPIAAQGDAKRKILKELEQQYKELNDYFSNEYGGESQAFNALARREGGSDYVASMMSDYDTATNINESLGNRIDAYKTIIEQMRKFVLQEGKELNDVISNVLSPDEIINKVNEDISKSNPTEAISSIFKDMKATIDASVLQLNAETGGFDFLKGSAEDAAEAKRKFVEANKEVLQSIVASMPKVEEEAKALDNLADTGSKEKGVKEDPTSKIEKQYHKLFNSKDFIQGTDVSADFLKPFEDISATSNTEKLTNALSELSSVKEKLKASFDDNGTLIGDPSEVQDLLRQYDLLTEQIKRLKLQITAPDSEETIALKFAEDAKKAQEEAEAAAQKIKESLEKQFDKLSSSDKYINSGLSVEKFMDPYKEFTPTENMNKLKDALNQLNSVKERLGKSFDASGNLIGDPAEVQQLLNEYKNLEKEIKNIQSLISSPSSPENSMLKSAQEEAKRVAAEAKKAEQELERLKKSIDKKIEGGSYDKEISNAQSVVSKYEVVDKEKKSIPSEKLEGGFQYTQQQVETLKATIKEYSDALKELKTKAQDPLIDLEGLKNAEDKVKKIKDTLKLLTEDLKKNGTMQASGGAIDSFITKVEKFMINNPRLSADAKTKLKEFIDTLTSGAQISTEQLQGMKEALDQITIAEMKAGNTGKGIFEQMAGKIREGVAYLATKVSFYQLFNQFRQGMEVVHEFDDALTEMMKVSDETRMTLERYQKTTFDTADAIGTSALQIQQSTADWMRLGESLDEAAKSAKASTILMNVSEFDNINDATKSLVAMSKAYDDLSKMQIIDKLNEVGNNFAVSTSEAATALQASASALTTAGNDMDEALALITAGKQVARVYRNINIENLSNCWEVFRALYHNNREIRL